MGESNRLRHLSNASALTLAAAALLLHVALVCGQPPGWNVYGPAYWGRTRDHIVDPTTNHTIYLTTIMLSSWEASSAVGAPQPSSIASGVVRVSADVNASAAAAGSVRVTIDWRVAALSGQPISASLHGPAWFGDTAPSIITFDSSNISIAGPSHSYDLPTAVWELVYAGRTYVQIATSAYPAGEVRGHACFGGCALVALTPWLGATPSFETQFTISATKPKPPPPVPFPQAYGIAQMIVNERNKSCETCYFGFPFSWLEPASITISKMMVYGTPPGSQFQSAALFSNVPFEQEQLCSIPAANVSEYACITDVQDPTGSGRPLNLIGRSTYLQVNLTSGGQLITLSGHPAWPSAVRFGVDKNLGLWDAYMTPVVPESHGSGLMLAVNHRVTAQGPSSFSGTYLLQMMVANLTSAQEATYLHYRFPPFDTGSPNPGSFILLPSSGSFAYFVVNAFDIVFVNQVGNNISGITAPGASSGSISPPASNPSGSSPFKIEFPLTVPTANHPDGEISGPIVGVQGPLCIPDPVNTLEYPCG